MNIKLLVSDIDDTLIGNDLKLSQRTIDTIKKVQDKGVKVAIATGRTHDSALPYVDQLNLHGPVLSFQGAVVIDSITKETLRYCPLPLELAKEVLVFAEEHDCYAQYYSMDKMFIEEHCKESDGYIKLTSVPATAVGAPLVEKLDFDPVKILCIADTEKIGRLYELAKERFGDTMEIARSKQHYLEFTHPDANKGEAVKLLAKRYGIPMEEVMTIGDGLNDISMIKAAGLGVAIGNAYEATKAVADVIAAPQDEDGAAKAMEKYILNIES